MIKYLNLIMFLFLLPFFNKSMILTSKGKFSLKTLRKLTRQRTSLNCLFLQQTVSYSNSPCYQEPTLKSNERRYVALLSTIIKTTIMQRQCCHQLSIKASYTKCRTIIKQEIMSTFHYTAKTKLQRKRFNGVLNALLNSMKYVNGLKKTVTVRKSGVNADPSGLLKLGTYVKSKVGQVLKATNSTGGFNNITINIYNGTSPKKDSSSDEDVFNIPTMNLLDTSGDLTALNAQISRRYKNNYQIRDKLRTRGYDAFHKRTGPLISDKVELNKLRGQFDQHLNKKASVDDGQPKLKYSKQREPVISQQSKVHQNVAKIHHKKVDAGDGKVTQQKEVIQEQQPSQTKVVTQIEQPQPIVNNQAKNVEQKVSVQTQTEMPKQAPKVTQNIAQKEPIIAKKSMSFSDEDRSQQRVVVKADQVKKNNNKEMVFSNNEEEAEVVVNTTEFKTPQEKQKEMLRMEEEARVKKIVPSQGNATKVDENVHLMPERTKDKNQSESSEDLKEKLVQRKAVVNKDEKATNQTEEDHDKKTEKGSQEEQIEKDKKNLTQILITGLCSLMVFLF